MTARKKSAARRRLPPRDYDSSTFTFSNVVKWVAGLGTFIVGSAFIAAFTWLWDTNSKLIDLAAKVDVNASGIATMATVPINLATMQQQMINLQTTQSNANIALADRMNKLEQENRWRDRAGSGGGFQRR